MPRLPAGEAAAIGEPVAAAAPEAVPPPRRNSRAVAALTIAGVLVLGAAGLVVAQGPGLSHLAAPLPGTKHSRAGARSEAAARAVLPPAPIPAPAKRTAAAASPPAAAHKPKPLPAAYERPAPMPGARTAAIALPRPGPAAPSRAWAAPTPPRTAPARRTAPPALARRTAGGALGRRLRRDGDLKILEGDIASARLFYERAVDAGDARAALALGDSFNPAFLARLGVLGMRGDTAAAARWYRRARALGSPDAEKALHTLPR